MPSVPATLGSASTHAVLAISRTHVDRSDTGFNPFGIIAIGVALILLIILLIAFRRR